MTHLKPLKQPVFGLAVLLSGEMVLVPLEQT